MPSDLQLPTGPWRWTEPTTSSSQPARHSTWQVDHLDNTNSPVLSHTKPTMGEAPHNSVPQDSKPSTAPYRRNRNQQVLDDTTALPALMKSYHH